MIRSLRKCLYPRLLAAYRGLPVFMLSVSALAGCLALPYKGEEVPFEKDDFSFVVPNKTSRSDIEEYFSANKIDVNRLSDERNHIEIYHAAHHGAGVSYCMVYWGVECGDSASWYDSLGLFLFDDSDKVIDHEVFMHRRDAKSECTRFGVCAVAEPDGSEPHIEVLAGESSDRAAKDFVTSSDRCSVYVYVDLTSRILQSGSIFALDDGKPEYIDSRGFFLLPLKPGPHVLSMADDNDHQFVDAESVNIECRQDETYFLRGLRSFSFSERYRLDLQFVAAREGKRMVRERQLVLTTFAYPQN